MPIAQVLAWLSAGQTLVSVGVATIAQIKGFIATLHPGMSDADLNALLAAIQEGALRHKALADADAAG